MLGAILAALAAAGAEGAEPRLSAVADCEADPAALPAAVASLRGARARGSQATLTVRGLCRLAAPLHLGPEDSRVEWVGEGGAAAISGGVELPATSWRRHSPAGCRGCGSVWAAALNASVAPSRQLYVDGVRANRTFMPFPQDSATKHARGFASPLAADFTHNSGASIEMLHRGTHTCNYSSSIQWAETRVPVASVRDGSFLMVEPAYSHSNNNGNLLPCFLENAFELLGHPEHGRPGDYYQDADALYFVGPAPPRQAVLPQSLGLIVAANVSEWSVRGIAVQEATWKLSDS